MATTIDDLIDLKNQAVDACGLIVARWEKGDLAEAARACQDVVNRAEVYEAADEDDDASDVEEHERLESVCEDEDCPLRDPDKPGGHKIRDHLGYDG